MDKKEIYRLESEIQKEELNYRLTGDFEKLCKKTFQVNKLVSESIKPYNIEGILCTNKYNNILKYVGDQELRNTISLRERDFRNVRKQISKADYEERLRGLVVLRNQFAITAGFRDYLEYKYLLWGVDNQLLKNKISKVYVELSGQPSSSEFYLQLKEFNEMAEMKKEEQRKLLDQVLSIWRLDIEMSKINIHTENLPDFYIGACVPISIPEEIHVLVNLRSGLSGFSVFMHEIGHAYYYSHISDKLFDEERNAYNLILEEGVARLFENLAYAPQTLKSLFGKETDIYTDIANAFSMYQMCCIEFEELIYKEPSCEFDKAWEKLRKKYLLNEEKSWTSPHFFVSEPGYFAAYFLGGCWANDVYRYVVNNNININDFLLKYVCTKGQEIDYEHLLSLINF